MDHRQPHDARSARGLIVAGASVRAVAHSALRAGYAPWGLDLFADADLAACCPVRRVTDYPRGMLDLFAEAPAAPWMYTGGLENQPRLVDRLATVRTLYGNRREPLRGVRDPRRLAGVLAAAGLDFPETRPIATASPPDGAWLGKTCTGSGGAGVWVADRRRGKPVAKGWWQRRLEGVPCSAVFVSAGGESRLVGVTRQLVGAAWTGAGGFRYAGSIGPLPLTPSVRESWARIGDALAAAFDLVGLWGVDGLLVGESVWTVEVNPRYTASVEVLERALDVAAVGWHVAACRDGRLPADRFAVAPAADRPAVAGKAVLYARRDLTAGRRLATYVAAANADAPWPRVADLPVAATEIGRGRPLLTLLAEGEGVRNVEQQLRSQTAELERVLYGGGEGGGY